MAFDSVSKTLHSLTNKVGNSERERRYEIAAVTFLRLMQQIGGTFIWTDGPKRGDKFSTIWEALTTRLPGYSDLGLMQKGEFIEENAPTLRQGCMAARKWLSTWFGVTVYVVPQFNEAALPTVITFDPDYKLDSGKTAAEMQHLRESKLVTGQVGASAKRLVACLNGDKIAVNKVLTDILDRACAELEQFKPGRRLTFDGGSAAASRPDPENEE